MKLSKTTTKQTIKLLQKLRKRKDNTLEDISYQMISVAGFFCFFFNNIIVCVHLHFRAAALNRGRCLAVLRAEVTVHPFTLKPLAA